MRPYLTLHSPHSARRYYDAEIWRRDTLYGLLRSRGSEDGDRIALTDGHRSMTWRDLLAWVDGIGFELRGYGLTAGDRVGNWMSSRMESIAVLLACSREGFACCPGFRPDQTCAEVAHAVRRLTVRALFVEPSWGTDREDADFDAFLASIPSLRAVFDTDFFPQAATNLTRWNSDPDRVTYLALGDGRGIAATYAMHSDNTLLAGARELVARDGVRADETILLLRPLHDHVTWIHVAQWLLVGCRIVIDTAVAPGETGDRIRRYDATHVVASPIHLSDILDLRRRSDAGSSRLRSVLVTGTLVHPKSKSDCRSAGLSLYTAYSTAETSGLCYTDEEQSWTRPPLDDVEPNRATQFRLFDPFDLDAEVEVGTIGHIGMSGAGLMLGYFDDQSMTERSFNEIGWFLSRDFGIVDAEGRLSIVGRSSGPDDDSGYIVDPAHLEALALRHSDVHEAVCFGIPDKLFGTRTCIAVAGSISPETLARHFEAAGLHHRDLPDFMVHLNALPGVSGDRAAKRALAEMARRRTLDLIPLSRTGATVLRPAG